MNAARCGVPRYWPSWRAALEPADVKPLVRDRDAGTSEIAANWLAQSDGNPLIDIYPRPGDFVDSVTVRITPGIKPATVRFTLDGSEPTPKSRSGSPGQLTDTTTIKAALFVSGQKVGNTLVGTYRKKKSTLALPGLGTVETPTTVEQVLSRLPSANPKRGPGLFNAAGCVACHRAGNEGRAVGPDLRTIGDRDDADSLIRSILTPNQIIVEGYGLLTVSTRDGKGFAGIFESESDRTLYMVQLNGEAVAIDKSTIVSRRNIHQSPMPAFDRVLNPQDLADLAAWLMTQRGAPVGGAAAIPTGTSLQARGNAGFAWELKPDRLSIVHAGRPLTDYVFSDPQVLRPHFQNLRTPSGAQVTAPILPAMAMRPITQRCIRACGWRSATSTARTSGATRRIEHVAFTAEPAVAEGRLTFATENRLIAQDGMPLATQRSRFAFALHGEHAYLLTWESEIRSESRELVFGDQEEMGRSARGHEHHRAEGRDCREQRWPDRRNRLGQTGRLGGMP